MPCHVGELVANAEVQSGFTCLFFYDAVPLAYLIGAEFIGIHLDGSFVLYCELLPHPGTVPCAAQAAYPAHKGANMRPTRSKQAFRQIHDSDPAACRAL